MGELFIMKNPPLSPCPTCMGLRYVKPGTGFREFDSCPDCTTPILDRYTVETCAKVADDAAEEYKKDATVDLKETGEISLSSAAGVVASEGIAIAIRSLLAKREP